MNSSIKEAISTSRRSCDRCNLQKTFRPNDDDRELARRACRNAANLFREEFESKRRDENTTNEEIEELKKGKLVCLDALEACDSCKKENPKIKNILFELIK